MRPSRLLLQLLTGWSLTGFVATLCHLFFTDLAHFSNLTFWFISLVILALTAIDGLMIPKQIALEVKRDLPSHMALGLKQGIDLTITNRSTRQQYFYVTDFAPVQIKVEGLPFRAGLDVDEKVEIKYWATPLNRGPAQFQQVCCRVTSAWYLWEKRYYFAEPQLTKVYPNYKPLFKSSFVQTDQLYADLGIQLRPRRGEGTDFHQLREFRVGDSIRQIDWRATARFQKPISREYQEERDQQVIFLLDCGRRMRAKDGEISHFDHALNALLISAFVALRQGDSVGLLSFSGEIRWVNPVKGRSQINEFLNQIYDLDSSLSASDFAHAAQQVLARQTRRALVVLVSTLAPADRTELQKAAQLLSKHHLVMVASMREEIVKNTIRADIETLDDALQYCEVNRQLDQQEIMLSDLRASNIIVTDTQPSQLHTSLVREYMALKRSGVF